MGVLSSGMVAPTKFSAKLKPKNGGNGCGVVGEVAGAGCEKQREDGMGVGVGIGDWQGGCGEVQAHWPILDDLTWTDIGMEGPPNGWNMAGVI